MKQEVYYVEKSSHGNGSGSSGLDNERLRRCLSRERQFIGNGRAQGKSIVVYYSASGHTKQAAETIAKETGSDLFAITPKVPYTEADLDYNNSSSRVSMEHKDSSIRPEYTGDAANWDDYRVVYLGYPIWWGEAPAIVYTFTEHHSFEGKTVIPFATSYSSPLGDSGENLARAAKTGTWLPGECFTGGGKTDDVLGWIHSLKK